MLLALLLLTRAAAEWVEISQQHYRKPVRPTTPGVPTRNPHQNEDINPYLHEPTRNYDGFNKPEGFVTQKTRNSTVNLNFNRDVNTARVNPFLQGVSQSPAEIYVTHSPTRDIQHVEQESTKEAYPNSSITEHKWKVNTHRLSSGYGDVIPTKITNYGNWNDDRTAEIIRQTDVTNTRIKDEPVPGKIERVSNVGTVKRVDLTNTPVLSPSVNKIIEKTANRGDNINPSKAQNYDSFSDEIDVKTNIFDSHEDSSPRKPYKQYHSTSDVITQVDIEKRKKSPFDIKKNPITSYSPAEVPFPISDLSYVPDTIGSTVHKVGNTISPAHTSKPIHQFTSHADTLLEFVTKHNETIEPENETIKEAKNKLKSNEIRNKHHESGKNEKVVEDSLEKGEDTSSEVKVNTMENVLKFMKLVADTISKNTKRGANGKIAYLNELKHSLLDNIKSRIDATFPDEDSASARRRSRSASPRGHVEFPSSESALMTISFLTFAVFLIKLVLQVIQTYKHKTMVMAPLVVATARRIATKLRANI